MMKFCPILRIDAVDRRQREGPPDPQVPEPSPNASMSTQRRTAMPMQPAMVRFLRHCPDVEAERRQPAINPQVSTNVTIAKAMANIRFQVKMKVADPRARRR